MTRKVGLLGGSFDPIHHGHLIIARSVCEHLDLESVVFLPSSNPPHKRREVQASPEHRAAMIRMAIADESGFEFDDHDLNGAGPSYTIDTIESLRRGRFSECELYWIIGADWISGIASWHRATELIETCNIVTASRAGEPVDWSRLRETLSDRHTSKLRSGVIETPVIDISSTDIRDRIRKGRSIRFLVPDSVRQYISEQHLYMD